MPHNVILICADQWRGDAFSIADHPTVRTPYLDELADQGAFATHAYSASPTCVPARMNLFTGLRAASHGRVGYQDGVPFDVQTTLAGEFKKAGYHTKAIGKMHLWPERVRAGFDDVTLHDGYLHHSRRRDRDQRSYDDYLTWLRDQAGTEAVADYLDDGVHCNSMVARPWPREERLHPTSWAVTQAIDFLYRRDPTVPFFLYLSFHRPHPPYDPPQWAFDQFMAIPPHDVPVGDWVDDYASFRNDRRPDSHVAVYPEYDMHRAQAGYYGNMAHIDQQLERFFEALGEFGLRQDSYIAFTSDHGEMMGDHNMWRKGYPYEGSSRIPFILSGPGIAAKSKLETVIELQDVMPTLLDLAGLPIPDGLDGDSFLAHIKDPDGETSQIGRQSQRLDAPWRPFMHGEHVVLKQSLQWIRTDRFKYVWLSGSGREQLFDMENDPSELHNLAADPAYRDDLEMLRGYLIQALRGREEGFVRDDKLQPGRPVSCTLSHAGREPVGVDYPAPVFGIAAP